MSFSFENSYFDKESFDEVVVFDILQFPIQLSQ